MVAVHGVIARNIKMLKVTCSLPKNVEEKYAACVAKKNGG